MKILQQLKENHYTESEQQVIDYLLDHLEDLTLLSINDLAKKSYTSNANWLYYRNLKLINIW